MGHVISGNGIEHRTDCLYFAHHIIVVTDRNSVDMNSGDMEVIKVEENDARKSFGYHLNENVKFQFAL